MQIHCRFCVASEYRRYIVKMACISISACCLLLTYAVLLVVTVNFGQINDDDDDMIVYVLVQLNSVCAMCR